MLAHVSLRVLHVAFAALWFGVPLGNPAAVKRAFGQGVEATRMATRDANRRGLIAAIAGTLVLATGVAIILNQGGFSVAHKNIHMSLGLVVIMLGISFGWMKTNGSKLLKLVEAADFALPSEPAATLVKRLNIGAGILQLLWLVVLALMFWR